MLSALRLPGARWAATAHALDYTVEFASMVGLMALVYSETDRPVLVALMLLCKQVVPGAVVALRGATFDRLDLRRGLALSAGVRVAGFAALAALGYGWWVYPLALALGFAGVGSRVLVRAAVARLTAGPSYRELTALLNVGFGVVGLAGPALGALLVGVAGAQAALVIFAGLSLALVAAGLAAPKAARTPVAASALETDGEEPEPAPRTRRGVPVPIWSLLALGAIIIGAFSMDEPALLAYSQSSLGAGVGGFGAIVTAWGIGLILGGLVYGRVVQRSLIGVFAAGVVAAAAGYIGLGLAPTLAWACAASVIGGGGNGIYWVALVTTVIEHASPGEEARQAARVESLPTVAPAVGIVLGGVVAEWLSPRLTLLIPGLVVVAALLLWAAMLAVLARRHEPMQSLVEVTA